MLRLYAYEWKKLCKKKINVVCLVLLVCCIGYQTYSTYDKYVKRSSTLRELTVEGVTYTGLEAVRFVDEWQHRYAGEMDEAWIKQREEIVSQKAQEADVELVVDEQAIQEQLGPDWKEYYQACVDQTLTYETYSEIYPEIKNYAEYDPDAILPVESFLISYTEESRKAYSIIYSLYNFKVPFYMLDRENYMLDRDKVDDELRLYRQGDINSLNAERDVSMIAITQDYGDEQIQAINQQMMGLPMYYDASYAYDYFETGVDTLIYTYVFMLALLAMLISGLYNQEYTDKTDQMMRGVVIGGKQQAIAKILVGLTLTLAVFLMLVFSICVVPHILIGYNSLSQAMIQWPITMLENMGMFLLLLGVSCLSYGAVFLILSSYLEGRFTCLIASLLWVAVTCLGGYVIEGLLGIDHVLKYLPGSFVLMPFHYEPTIVFGVNIMRSYLIATGWLLVSLALLYFSYRHYHCRDITNA